jgi:acetylglutamate kinase
LTLTVTYATDAIQLGVKGAFITDGRVPHALLNEILAGGEEGLGSGEGGTIVTL